MQKGIKVFMTHYVITMSSRIRSSAHKNIEASHKHNRVYNVVNMCLKL